MTRTRIAPSPTGNDIHIGNLYTALINWVVARKNNGQFIVRIEDTDRTRFVEGAESMILTSLADYGLKNDEGPNVGGPNAPYRQSERLELYKKYAQELVEKGKAYYSFVTKEQLEEFRNKEKRIPICSQRFREKRKYVKCFKTSISCNASRTCSCRIYC